MASYVKIPTWIVYRSAMLPCGVYTVSNHGGHDLLLVENQPVPKLQIRRLMKRGIDWLYIEKKGEGEYRKYVQKFLHDSSVPGWVGELVNDGRGDLLEFPPGVTMPETIRDHVDRGQGPTMSDVVSSAASSSGGIEREPQYKIFKTSLGQFKQQLLMITSEGTLDLSRPQDFRKQVGDLRSKLDGVPGAGLIRERLDTIEEVIQDGRNDELENSLPEIVAEISAIEVSLSENASFVDSGLESESAELSELYDYKNKLEQENQRLLDENKKLKESETRARDELASVNSQYQQLYEEYDQHQRTEQKVGEGSTIDRSLAKKIGGLEDKVQALREEAVQHKMNLGRATTKIQELEKQLRQKELELKRSKAS